MDIQDIDKNMHDDSRPQLAEATDQPLAIVPELKPSESSTPPSIPPQTALQGSIPSQRLREVQDSVLHFFANASNETLGACAVGLCASTYLVLGRVGLVLIGAVGGIVLHATWEQNQHGQDNEKGRIEAAKRRREQGLEVAKRALEWRDKSRADLNDEIQDKLEPSASTKDLDYSNFQTNTRQALTEFTDAVIRDYVKWWYGPILPAENSFPASCRQVLASFILSFSNHVSRKRTEDPFLDFIANATSIIIVFLNELGSALKASPSQDVESAIKTYLHYEPESSLANVLSTTQHERKLHLVAEDILQSFLDSKTYSCIPAQAFLREVLAGLILQPTITSCSKAEWINGWIVYLLEDGEPEIMNVIDEGVGSLGGTITNPKAGEGTNTEERKHQRRVSRAEEAMQEAMKEAQRLNEMIAEDEARRKRGESVAEAETTYSASTTDAGIPTPNSSISDLNRHMPESANDTMIFDSEGNAMPSGTISPSRNTSVPRQQPRQFTSFDQIAPNPVPVALQTESHPPSLTEAMSAIPLTLHNANITLLDMGVGNDRLPLKQKPNDEFLVQIEPSSSRFPGWMVTRKYPDFEPLHETIRRIATVSGVHEFNQQHHSIPAWKGQTRYSLISLLETYLRQALKHERLAESEAMKKFLGKDIGLDKLPGGNKNVLFQGAAALDNVGKGFINVLGQGGKGIAGGGKAVLGGVQGVFGAVGSAVGAPKKVASPARGSVTDLSRTSTGTSSTLNSGRPSLDFVGGNEYQDDVRPPLPSRPSTSSIDQLGSPSRVSALQSQELLNLPPPPSEMTEDFVPTVRTSESFHRPGSSVGSKASRPATPTQSRSHTPNQSVSTPQPHSQPQAQTTPLPPTSTSAIPLSTSNTIPTSTATTTNRPSQPLTEEETRITVDLIFAIITSTYSLSSAWAFRLSLLTAAKTYLLRPTATTNPQLDSIRTLLQESLINNNTSDTGIATHIRTLRANTLPTEAELATWPAEMSDDAKEKLRVKARKLLVERGMPQALTSVMGQAASGEALGKVFDCLQVESVARGLVFALVLQGLRAVMQ